MLDLLFSIIISLHLTKQFEYFALFKSALVIAPFKTYIYYFIRILFSVSLYKLICAELVRFLCMICLT